MRSRPASTFPSHGQGVRGIMDVFLHSTRTFPGYYVPSQAQVWIVNYRAWCIFDFIHRLEPVPEPEAQGIGSWLLASQQEPVGGNGRETVWTWYPDWHDGPPVVAHLGVSERGVWESWLWNHHAVGSDSFVLGVTGALMALRRFQCLRFSDSDSVSLPSSSLPASFLRGPLHRQLLLGMWTLQLAVPVSLCPDQIGTDACWKNELDPAISHELLNCFDGLQSLIQSHPEDTAFTLSAYWLWAKL